MELRAVFVLSELEEMTMAEIAAMTGARPGTVASGCAERALRLPRRSHGFTNKKAEGIMTERHGRFRRKRSSRQA